MTDLDLAKLREQCEADIPPASSANRRIIFDVPMQYKIDGTPVLGNPSGMTGNKLEQKMIFITCLDHHVADLIQAVNEAGIEVEDVMAAPIAAGFVTLSKSQKVAGCVLANIGAETVSIAVFENSIPTSLEVFPIGSTDITNDIALGLKVPLEEAEQIKIGAITGSIIPAEEARGDRGRAAFGHIRAHRDASPEDRQERAPAGGHRHHRRRLRPEQHRHHGQGRTETPIAHRLDRRHRRQIFL